MADLGFEALCEACSINWQDGITADQRGRVNQALKQLRSVYSDDITLPDMIRERADAYREVFPQMVLTPQALIAHWSSILEQRDQIRERRERERAKQRSLTNAHAKRGCLRCGDDHYIVIGLNERGFETSIRCPDCQ